MYELVASAINHPDRVNTLWGVFNRRSLTSLSQAGVRVSAAVPRPHAPPVGPYSDFREIPEHDESFSYPVAHPRFWYYLPKSLLYHRSGDSMASALQEWRVRTDIDGDIFHGCHLYPDGYALSSLSEREDVPLTAYAHGTIVNEFEEFNRPTRDRIRTVLTDADCLFCSGHAIESKIRHIEPGASTEVVPIGADPQNFPTDRDERLRRELGVPREATVVLYCGRFTSQKGVHDLIGALRSLDADSVYVVCIGHGGDLQSELLTAMSAPETPSGTVLSDLRPVAVRRWFAVADLFVLPSYSEGRPTVIYEAMASETPAIGTAVGGVPEQIKDGETGWILEPGDVERLSTVLQNAMDVDLEPMGDAARERLETEGWTWESHANELAAIHQSLIDSYD